MCLYFVCLCYSSRNYDNGCFCTNLLLHCHQPMGVLFLSAFTSSRIWAILNVPCFPSNASKTCFNLIRGGEGMHSCSATLPCRRQDMHICVRVCDSLGSLTYECSIPPLCSISPISSGHHFLSLCCAMAVTKKFQKHFLFCLKLRFAWIFITTQWL